MTRPRRCGGFGRARLRRLNNGVPDTSPWHCPAVSPCPLVLATRFSRSFSRTLHGRGELKEPTFFICLFIFIRFIGGRGLSYNVCTVLNKNYKLH